MTASPFDQNSWARHISDDGHAIGAAGDMPPILVRKPHSRTGTVHKPFYPFFENIIGHMKNSFCGLAALGIRKTAGRLPILQNCQHWHGFGGGSSKPAVSCLFWYDSPTRRTCR